MIPPPKRQHGGWHFNLRQRARIVQGREMLQPPTPDDAGVVRAASLSTKTVEGIPVDVLMTLESLRQLAEQGNLAAKWLYEEERVKLGIDRPLFMES